MNRRLQQFLRAENISQSQFADTIGVARASVSHILAGRNKPGFDFLLAMSKHYPSLNLEWLITLRTTVAFCNERIEVYVAKNLVPSKQHLDPNEFVNVELHTVEELKQMIFDGEIEDSKTVASILAYDAKYNRK